MHPRFDFTFSYWIFAWFLLYMLGIIPFNPKTWFILATIYLILFFSYVSFVYRIDNFYILFEIIINFFIKIIPILILYNTKTTWYDFLFGIFLFIVFGIYLFIQLGSFSKIKKYHKFLWNKKIHNEIYTPLLYYYYKN